MSSARSRLDKIALSLTPRQAVLAYIREEVQQFDDWEDLGRWLAAPATMAQVHRRWENVENEIKRQMKGKPALSLQKALRQAREDICFLLALQHTANLYLLEQESGQDLMLAYRLFQLQTFIQEYTTSAALESVLVFLDSSPNLSAKDRARHGETLRKHIIRCGEDGKGRLPYDAEPFTQKLKRWQVDVSAFLATQTATREALKALETQFFEGHSIVLRGLWDKLHKRISMLESILSQMSLCFADLLDQAEPCPDIAEEERSAITQSILTRARLQTLEQLGREKEALPILHNMMSPTSHVKPEDY